MGKDDSPDVSCAVAVAYDLTSTDHGILAGMMVRRAGL